MPQGKFISFEGGEGSGKSTQIQELANRLEARGVPVLRTREPGGSEGAEQIRRLVVEGAPDRWSPLAELMLMYAARADHLQQTIRPALERGTWVLCDRFLDSSMAYQGYAHALGRSPVEQLNRLVIAKTLPDLTFILDLPVSEGLARVTRRNGQGENRAEDRFERMTDGFHEMLRKAFLDIARREPARCSLIDAHASADTVATRIWVETLKRLEIKA